MANPAHPLPSVPPLPTEDELPYDDGEPLESARHRQQMELLLDALHQWLDAHPDAYAAGNMFVHFWDERGQRRDFRGPDFFLALGTSRRERKSWVVWQEGKPPDVVIELLSESTAKYDKTAKKAFYQDHLRVREYFWYDPFDSQDLAGFALTNAVYQPIAPDPRGRLVSPLLGLALARWQGTYQDVEATWLRWETPDGTLLPTRAEAQAQRADAEARRAERATEWADQETQRADQETQRADQETQRADQETQRADQETQRAEQEAHRADSAEAEAARLRALLAEKE
jgi:Uma2 family endonuclease